MKCTGAVGSLAAAPTALPLADDEGACIVRRGALSAWLPHGSGERCRRVCLGCTTRLRCQSQNDGGRCRWLPGWLPGWLERLREARAVTRTSAACEELERG